MLSVKGEAKPLSFDHKPMNESEFAVSLAVTWFHESNIMIAEMQRIRKAGGYIEYGRVNGMVHDTTPFFVA